MPLKSWNTKADFDSSYNIGAEPEGHPITRPEVRLHYSRAVMFPIAQLHAQKMVEILGLLPAQRVVVVGSGFGWVIEALQALGITNVAGTDTSTYIQGNKAQTEEADIDAEIAKVGLNPLVGEGQSIKSRLAARIGGDWARSKVPDKVLNEDMATNQSRTRIRNFLGGGTIDWAISDSVLESLTDAECTTASSRAHSLATNVAHLVVTARPGTHPGFNWKTLEQWKALIPADRFIEIGGQWRSL